MKQKQRANHEPKGKTCRTQGAQEEREKTQEGKMTTGATWRRELNRWTNKEWEKQHGLQYKVNQRGDEVQVERHWKPGRADETDVRQVWRINQCVEEGSNTGETRSFDNTGTVFRKHTANTHNITNHTNMLQQLKTPSGPNLIRSQINTTNQSQGECLRIVYHSPAYCWQPPSPMQVQCLTLPGQMCSSPNCKQWRGGNWAKMPHHCPPQREEIRRLTGQWLPGNTVYCHVRNIVCYSRYLQWLSMRHSSL